jgi:hypothetical protein
MSLPQHHYVTKEYRNPVTWEVYTDICLERGPQYVRSTKRRSIFLPLNRYVTKRHIHPVTGEAFTNVCLEQGSSSSWSDDSLRAPKRMRIHRAPRKGFHGTPTLCDQRRCLGSLDDMQGNTDVLVVGDVSGTLHGITPTLVDSTARRHRSEGRRQQYDMVMTLEQQQQQQQQHPQRRQPCHLESYDHEAFGNKVTSRNDSCCVRRYHQGGQGIS